MTQVQIGKSPRGQYFVWEKPQPGYEYILGADVAQGATFGTANERGDSSTICILKRNGMILEQVLEARSKVENFQFGEICAAFGSWYNNAIINIERNLAHGVIAGLRAADYPVDKWYVPPQQNSVLDQIGMQYFLHKNSVTSKMIIDTLVDYMDPNMPRLIVRSKRLLAELTSLQKDANGRVVTNSKDITIALAMAVFVASTEGISTPDIVPEVEKKHAPFGVDKAVWDSMHKEPPKRLAFDDEAPEWEVSEQFLL